MNKLKQEMFVSAAATLILVLVTACQRNDPGAVQGGGEGGLDNDGAKTEFRLVARNNSFESRRLVAVTNSEITLTLANQDAGILHNFAVYRSRDAKEVIFRDEIITSVAKQQYQFMSPVPGSLLFSVVTSIRTR